MLPLFLGLTLANLASLLTTMALGYVSLGGRAAVHGWHMLAGALAAILCVAVHCIVFTYFLATAKWIEHAVMVKGLDASYVTPVKSFRVLAFPAALGAMAVTFVAAILGAGVDTRVLSVNWHHGMALLAVAANVGAAAIEYVAIGRNGRLIDQILAEFPEEETPIGRGGDQ
jgi:hypothetical protein